MYKLLIRTFYTVPRKQHHSNYITLKYTDRVKNKVVRWSRENDRETTENIADPQPIQLHMNHVELKKDSNGNVINELNFAANYWETDNAASYSNMKNFLANHPSVSFPDSNGLEQNKNLISAEFVLIDIQEETNKKTELNHLITDARLMLRNAILNSEDPNGADMLFRAGYSCGENVSGWDIKDVYNYLCDISFKKPEFIIQTFNNNDFDFIIGTYIKMGVSLKHPEHQVPIMSGGVNNKYSLWNDGSKMLTDDEWKVEFKTNKPLFESFKDAVDAASAQHTAIFTKNKSVQINKAKNVIAKSDRWSEAGMESTKKINKTEFTNIVAHVAKRAGDSPTKEDVDEILNIRVAYLSHSNTNPDKANVQMIEAIKSTFNDIDDTAKERHYVRVWGELLGLT